MKSKTYGASLVRGSLMYMSIGLIQRAAAFLLLPMYANVLAPAEYGVIAVLLTTVGAAQYVLSFGLETAVFRGYFVHIREKAECDRYMNTLGLFLLVAPGIIVAVAAMILGLFVPRLGPVAASFLIVELASAAIYVAASTMPLALVRARESLGSYLAINGAFAAVQVCVKALFVLVFHWGVAGWVWADLVASVCMLVMALFVSGHRWTRDFDVAALKDGLRIGIPLLPHLMSHWILALSDRIVVSGVLNARAVGLYNMGYQFGILLGIILSEINRALMPAYGRAIGSEQESRRLRGVISIQILSTATLGLLTALLAPPLVHLLLPPAYAGAAIVIPAVALGYVLYGWYYVPMNVISVIAGDTKFVAVPTVIAASLQIGLNVLLLPRFGIVAAGVNTAISYGVLLCLVSAFKRARIEWSLEIDWRAIGLRLLFLGGVGVLAWRMFPGAGIAVMTGRAILVLCAALGAILPMMHRSEMRTADAVLEPSITG